MSDDLPPEEMDATWADSDAQKAGVAPASKEDASREQLLPDGLGLTVEAVRGLLHEKNGLSIPKDDPMLMQVTILNAFLEEEARLAQRHEKALGMFMTRQTDAFSTEVGKQVSQLSDSLSGVTVQGIQAAAKDFSADLASLRSTLWLCTAIIASSAMLNVVVFVLRGMR